MKILRTLVLASVSMIALTSCASKTTYAKFHEKAVEASKALETVTVKGTTVTSKGTMKSNGVILDLTGKLIYTYENGELVLDENNSDIKNIAGALLILAALVSTAEGVGEDQSGNTTYYTGPLSISVKDKDGNKSSTTFDKYGKVAKDSGKGKDYNYSITAKWSYEKK